MSHFELLPNDDGRHSLLEPPSPAYTNVTVRRALIVWLHCGQQNEFKHVCNYYHYLEALEEQLKPEDRASSRHHEFSLLSDYPPSSQYLTRSFPKLYKHNKNEKIKVKQIEEIKLEDCVFNLEGFHNLKTHKGVTTKEIIKTSQIIRKYCKTHSKTLRGFLSEFQDFAKKTNASKSVNNILIYIKRKYLKDEIETWNNMPKNFNFLEISEYNKKNNDKFSEIVVEDSKTVVLNENNNITNKIRILINENRRKELMNLIPRLTDIKIKDCENNNLSNQKCLSEKIIQYRQKENYDSNI